MVVSSLLARIFACQGKKRFTLGLADLFVQHLAFFCLQDNNRWMSKALNVLDPSILLVLPYLLFLLAGRTESGRQDVLRMDLRVLLL